MADAFMIARVAWRRILLAMSTTVLAASASKDVAKADEFYRGKILTFIVGTSAGGGYDQYMRILAEFMPKHIPGQPTAIVQNIPNASGQGAAARVYSQSPKDGTVLATYSASVILAEALNPEQVRFRSKELGWIGTITTMTDVLAVMKTSGVATLEDAKGTEVLLGATGSTSALRLQPALVNALLGTKFKIIGGYAGGNEVNLAMDRGEVRGRTNQWDSWKAQRPQWINEGQLNYLLQIGPKSPELPNVPALSDLVTSDSERALVDLLEVLQWVGRAVNTTPDVPDDRLRLLRRAFDDTMNAPDFLARIQALGLEKNSRSGEETQAYVTRTIDNSKTIAKRFKEAVGLK